MAVSDVYVGSALVEGVSLAQLVHVRTLASTSNSGILVLVAVVVYSDQ